MEFNLSPQRPYLLRALYDWLLDNDCTPHVVVDASQPFVDVPQEHIKDDQIVLNIHPAALTNFTMDLEHVSFEARFGGIPRRIYLPIAAIVAIYARENGAGTIFEAEPGLTRKQTEPSLQPLADAGELTRSDEATKPAAQTEHSEGASPRKRPTLTVVK